MSEVDTSGCCPPSRCPALKTGTTGEGQIIQTKGIDVYVSGNANSERVVVVIADIFGFKSGRHFGICDFFAKNGFYVVMPDLFDKKVPENDLKKFISKLPIELVQKRLDTVYAEAVPNSCKWIGMIGFCFGCWVIFHESSRMKPAQLKCAVNCHPSIPIEGLFGRDVDSLARSINHPMLLVPTKGDHASVQQGTYLEKEKQVEVLDYSHQAHGFVSQGDVENDEKTKNDVLNVMNYSLEFFSKY